MVAFIVAFSSAGVGLLLYALRENVNLFYPPSTVVLGEAPLGQRIRIGGMVEEGSLRRVSGMRVEFALTDFVARVPVSYQGLLPDLFAEGQGAVLTGRLEPGPRFVAESVLAKHDENYMPPELGAMHAANDADSSRADDASAPAQRGEPQDQYAP